MTWLTYLIGLGLFVFGIYTKLAWFLTDWTAFLPVLFGLAYTTCGEGMRSLPKRRRIFLALAIILSMIVPAAVYPLLIHLPDVMDGKVAEWDSGRLMQPGQVYQATVTATVSLLYLSLAFLAWSRMRTTPEKHVKL